MSPTTKEKANQLFLRAEKAEERGDTRTAFRLLLPAARLGDMGAQINVGNYYDNGTGVRRNRSAALHWFRKAYRRGDSTGAHNIGVVWRNECMPKRALLWFHRAVRLGDPESNIDIAKHYFNTGEVKKAIRYLERVKPSGWVSNSGVEEAARLLKKAKNESKNNAGRVDVKSP